MPSSAHSFLHQIQRLALDLDRQHVLRAGHRLDQRSNLLHEGVAFGEIGTEDFDGQAGAEGR
jgi:hypothetical protein